MFPIVPKCQPGLNVERKENSMAPQKASLELYGSLNNQKFLKQVKETKWSRSVGAAFGGDGSDIPSHPVSWGVIKVLEVEDLPSDESYSSSTVAGSSARYHQGL